MQMTASPGSKQNPFTLKQIKEQFAASKRVSGKHIYFPEGLPIEKSHTPGRTYIRVDNVNYFIEKACSGFSLPIIGRVRAVSTSQYSKRPGLLIAPIFPKERSLSTREVSPSRIDTPPSSPPWPATCCRKTSQSLPSSSLSETQSSCPDLLEEFSEDSTLSNAP